MKAAIYTTKEELEIKTIPEPELSPGGAVIKVAGCGLCGSDIVKIRQKLIKPGTVPGHEVVGYIDKIDSNDVFKPGDRVVIGHHVPCFDCVYCKNENYSMCRQFKETNIIPGGFCEYISITDKHLANTVFKIPNHIPDEHAHFTEPAACCLRAVQRAMIIPRDIVLVSGLGSIGLIMGQILKHFGAIVIGTDILDDRLRLAKSLGFDEVYKYTDDDEISALIRKNFQQEGTDKVFLTSGSLQNISTAVKTIRDGGLVMVFASIPDNKSGIPNNEIYYRELTILGSYSPSPEDLKNSLKMIEQSMIKVDNLVTNYNILDINKAILATKSNKTIKSYIKIL